MWKLIATKINGTGMRAGEASVIWPTVWFAVPFSGRVLKLIRAKIGLRTLTFTDSHISPNLYCVVGPVVHSLRCTSTLVPELEAHGNDSLNPSCITSHVAMSSFLRYLGLALRKSLGQR